LPAAVFVEASVTERESRFLKNLGWLATGVMVLAVVAMLLAILPARR